jgi:hypothetical protein
MTHVSHEPDIARPARRFTASAGVAAREKRLSAVPPRYRRLYEAAWVGRSRKSAIRAFCLECVGWQPSEVRRCTARTCPLYEFRVAG